MTTGPLKVAAEQEQSEQSAALAAHGKPVNNGTYAGFTMDQRKLEIVFNGVPLRINKHADFKVLAVLVRAAGGVVSHMELLRAVKPDEVADTVALVSNADQEVNDSIAHIRKAMREASANCQLRNVKGVGYQLLPSHD